MRLQLLEEVRAAALDREEQQAEEVEEREGRVDADVGGGGRDALHAEAGVRGGELGGEEEEGFVGRARVADQKVREDGAGGVEGCGGGLITAVPVVFHVGEDLGGV